EQNCTEPIDESPQVWNSLSVTTLPTLQPQEIPLDDPASCEMFVPSAEKPFVATPAAIDMYGRETILKCLAVLQDAAAANAGIDYLQVFKAEDKPEKLWFIEDGPGGAITALLPTDY
ncbi:MAG TPA: hypothetical protein VK137_07480, partial [Planctomycetaceae bacterium]|nr:hypothetical protein [Planctomycetaceae bacterium]